MKALQMLVTIPNLDNFIFPLFESMQRRENEMGSKHQFKVKLPTGERVWASGNTIDEMFASFAQIYGMLYQQTPAPEEKPKCQTLREFVDKTYRPSFMSGLKPTTQSNYENYLGQYILPYLGEMPMDEVSVATIQAFYNHLAQAGSHGHRKNLNATTIERVRGLTSRIFSIAQEMGLIKDTPFKNRLLTIKAEKGGHHKALPNAEIDRVKKTIPTLADEEIRLYFAMLAYTGMRRNELMGMHWEDVDLADGTAYVRCTVTYPARSKPVIQYSAKSEHSIRPILLPEPLIQLMKPLRKEKGVLFGGDAPWCYATLNRRVYRGKKLLGIQGFNNHDFRTTYGTQLKESGMTSAQVADLMGHADTRMVETVYARAREEGIKKRRGDLEKMNKQYAVLA